MASSANNNTTVPVPTADANETTIHSEMAATSPPGSVAGSSGSNANADANVNIIHSEEALTSPTASVAGTDGNNTAADANVDNIHSEMVVPTSPTASVAGTDGSETDIDADANINIVHSEMVVPTSPTASVAGTDGSETDAAVVPFTSPVGSAYTQDTPAKDFGDWSVYVSFCEDGRIICVECVDTVNDDGTPRQFNKLNISKKLLCDFSRYFKAMFKHDFEESIKEKVRFVDILQEEMMRLKLFLMSGTPKARINIGKPEEEMSNLVRTFELADRFDMPEIANHIIVRTTDFVVFHRNWRATYQQEVLEAPPVSTVTTARENFHRAKLLDFCKAHSMLLKLTAHARLVRPDQIVTLIAECCPPLLLHSMIRHMDKDLVFDVFRTVLANM